MFNPDVPIKLHAATKVGHLTRKGDLDNLKVGDLVGVYSEHAPIRFRVWGVALRMFLKLGRVALAMFLICDH